MIITWRYASLDHTFHRHKSHWDSMIRSGRIPSYMWYGRNIIVVVYYTRTLS